VRSPHVERLDEPGEAVVVLEAEPLGRIGGAADAGRVPGDDGVLVAQALELRLPGAAAVADVTVEEDHRRAAACPLEGDPQPVDLHLVARHEGSSAL
jgi:hypothetical protein